MKLKTPIWNVNLHWSLLTFTWYLYSMGLFTSSFLIEHLYAQPNRIPTNSTKSKVKKSKSRSKIKSKTQNSIVNDNKNQYQSNIRLKRLFESPRIEGDLMTSIHMNQQQNKMAFLKSSKTNRSSMELWTLSLSPIESPRLLLTLNQLPSDKKSNHTYHYIWCGPDIIYLMWDQHLYKVDITQLGQWKTLDLYNTSQSNPLQLVSCDAQGQYVLLHDQSHYYVHTIENEVPNVDAIIRFPYHASWHQKHTPKWSTKGTWLAYPWNKLQQNTHQPYGDSILLYHPKKGIRPLVLSSPWYEIAHFTWQQQSLYIQAQIHDDAPMSIWHYSLSQPPHLKHIPPTNFTTEQSEKTRKELIDLFNQPLWDQKGLKSNLTRILNTKVAQAQLLFTEPKSTEPKSTASHHSLIKQHATQSSWLTTKQGMFYVLKTKQYNQIFWVDYLNKYTKNKDKVRKQLSDLKSSSVTHQSNQTLINDSFDYDGVLWFALTPPQLSDYHLQNWYQQFHTLYWTTQKEKRQQHLFALPLSQNRSHAFSINSEQKSLPHSVSISAQAKVNQPKVNQPKTNQSKANQPKANQPKANQPKANQPKISTTNKENTSDQKTNHNTAKHTPPPSSRLPHKNTQMNHKANSSKSIPTQVSSTEDSHHSATIHTLTTEAIEKNKFSTITQTIINQLKHTSKLKPKTMTQRAGWHQIHMDQHYPVYLDIFSRTLVPPQATLYHLNGNNMLTLDANPALEWSQSQLPEILEFTLTSEKKHKFLSRLWLPNPNTFKKFPVIFMMQPMLLSQQWSNQHVWYNYLTQKGYAVFETDYLSQKLYNQLHHQIINIDQHVLITDMMNQVLQAIAYIQELDMIASDQIYLMSQFTLSYLALRLLSQGDTPFAKAILTPINYKLIDLLHSLYPVEQWPTWHIDTFQQQDQNLLDALQQIKSDLLLIFTANSSHDTMSRLSNRNSLNKTSLNLITHLQTQQHPFYLMFYPHSHISQWQDQDQQHFYTLVMKFFQKSVQ